MEPHSSPQLTSLTIYEGDEIAPISNFNETHWVTKKDTEVEGKSARIRKTIKTRTKKGDGCVTREYFCVRICVCAVEKSSATLYRSVTQIALTKHGLHSS